MSYDHQTTGRVVFTTGAAGGVGTALTKRFLANGDTVIGTDVNLTGYYLVTHTLLPLMKGRGWGRIVNFGSASM